MADQEHQSDEQDWQAPPALVAALQRLQPPAVVVPPEIDDVILRRVRAHLAGISEAQSGRAVGPPVDEATSLRMHWLVGRLVAILAGALALFVAGMLLRSVWTGHHGRGASPALFQQRPAPTAPIKPANVIPRPAITNVSPIVLTNQPP